MYTIETPEGEKYMVQLTGPKSYRYGDMHVRRGGTLTVARKTRDYLVKTLGFFSDYDPNPIDEVDEVLPPQFGEKRGLEVDLADMDPKNNPPLTREQAAMLAEQGGAVNQNGDKVADAAPAPKPKAKKIAAAKEGSGDMTSADLAGNVAQGGASKVKIGVQSAPVAPKTAAAMTVE